MAAMSNSACALYPSFSREHRFKGRLFPSRAAAVHLEKVALHA
jgi:hypothetical protein